jgi:hypothetical protein
VRKRIEEVFGWMKRHEFLVKRISGDEIDAFACEVATLSLILADYPNANGWKVSERDLFALVAQPHETVVDVQSSVRNRSWQRRTNSVGHRPIDPQLDHA